MKRVMFGSWLLLAGFGLLPDLWSPSWWVLVIGYAALFGGIESLLERRNKGVDQ